MQGMMMIHRGTLFGKSHKFVKKTALPEIGQIICMECGGSGNWPFHTNPKFKDDKCVTCKSTGKVYVS